MDQIAVVYFAIFPFDHRKQHSSAENEEVSTVEWSHRRCLNGAAPMSAIRTILLPPQMTRSQQGRQQSKDTDAASPIGDPSAATAAEFGTPPAVCNLPSSCKSSRRVSVASGHHCFPHCSTDVLTDGGHFSDRVIRLRGHRYEYTERADSLLGVGSYGTVFSGFAHFQRHYRPRSRPSDEEASADEADTSHRRRVAIKKVMRVSLRPNELRAMKRVRHPNLVRLVDICNADEPDDERAVEQCARNDADVSPPLIADPRAYTYLVMELCDGDLDRHLRCHASDARLNADDLRRVIECVASGYLALYEKRIVHRDIKPQNILLLYDSSATTTTTATTSGSWRIRTAKITDFGISRILTASVASLDDGVASGDVGTVAATAADDDEWDETTCFGGSSGDTTGGSNSSTVTSVAELCNVAGTFYYMAPEVGANLLKLSEYDSSADMWSIGCVIYQCLVGKIPFDESRLCRLFLYCAGGNYDAYELPPIPSDDRSAAAGAHVVDFIASLLQLDRRLRATPLDLYRRVMAAAEASANTVVDGQHGASNLPANLSSASLASTTSTLSGGDPRGGSSSTSVAGDDATRNGGR